MPVDTSMYNMQPNDVFGNLNKNQNKKSYGDEEDDSSPIPKTMKALQILSGNGYKNCGQ